MNERDHHYTPETRPAREGDAPDWRRLEVASGRFGSMIAEGIATALSEHTEIDDSTARCIAHVLGRAYGRQSALADFDRTGDGDYLSLRDEYLDLYADERADAITKEMIDWLGTYMIQREGHQDIRRFTNEHLPPKLDRVLVRSVAMVNEQGFMVHVPASADRKALAELEHELTLLQLPEDDALAAFLTLEDVNALSGNIMESFHESFAGSYATEEKALRALSPLEDWEASLADWCIDQGIDHEALEWNLEPLMERLRGIYDIVERIGVLHAFVK